MNRPPDFIRKEDITLTRPEQRSLVLIMLIFFVGLVALLSVNWTNQTIDPMVLLLGIFVAAIIAIAYRRSWRMTRTCQGCGHDVVAPPGSRFCHFCGARLFPEDA